MCVDTWAEYSVFPDPDTSTTVHAATLRTPTGNVIRQPSETLRGRDNPAPALSARQGVGLSALLFQTDLKSSTHLHCRPVKALACPPPLWVWLWALP